MVTLKSYLVVDDPLDATSNQLWESVKFGPSTRYTESQVRDIIESARKWAAIFKTRLSLAWAQILHETGRFRYGGQAVPEQFNFAGIGSTNDGARGHYFGSIDEGMLAFFCHRALYQWGNKAAWPTELQQFFSKAIRFNDVRDAGYLGVCTVVGDFTNGRWAWSPQYPKGTLQNGYAESLVRVANEILSYPEGDVVMTAQIPGFIWEPADSNHYERGRDDRIRGGAQHYTDGTNSLPWLTTTSNPAVSAHFLIKHNPTMSDRGWQLVRIEDTAWTTAFANPYTVAIEFEHKAYQTISDEAYRVMAQTWIDIAAYVKKHKLGEIALNRTGIKPHKEWVNNPQLICSDGVNVDRVVQEITKLLGAPAPQPTPVNDPNAHRFENGKWIVNVNYEGVGMVKMLDFYREQGGLPMLGLPLEGMHLEEVDGKRVFKQRCENVLLEFWPDGFGNMGAYYRFGAIPHSS